MSNRHIIQSEKDFSLTFIQLICSIAVVTLHTNGCFWQFSAIERYWFTANIIESICYFAVPVFFMITGITLLDYQDRYSTCEFFKKRAEKTLLPYVVWSLVGVVFLILTGRISAYNLSVKWIINGLLSTGGIIDLYWFFQPLFCVYLSIPLFSAIERDKKAKTIRYLLVTGFAINIMIPFVNNVLQLGIEWPYRLGIVLDYLYYVCGGWYIYHNPPPEKLKNLIILIGFVGLLMHICGTYVLSISANSIQRLFKGYNNFPCVVYTFSVFLILRDFGKLIEKKKVLKRIVLFLAKYTFPLYLIQWFILRIIDDLALFSNKKYLLQVIRTICYFSHCDSNNLGFAKDTLFKKNSAMIGDIPYDKCR